MAFLSTQQAARRLGVKPETLYAYVSRGLLASHRDADGRGSRFDAGEVERLALRGRPRRASQSPSLDIRIETRITEIDDHQIRFRGHDALDLARRATFEQVAELLWTGELPPTVPPPWRGRAVDVDATRVGDRFRVVAAQAAVGTARTREPATVMAEGKQLIATLVESLPTRGDGRCPRLILPDGSAHRGTLAGHLWTHLSPRRATPALVATLNAALVLLADHEMAASALAARVAASTRAGVHGVVAAGMGALSGPLHGGESERCRRLIARTIEEPFEQVIGDALTRYGRVPGFGQVLYPKGDPRAVLLLTMLREADMGTTMERLDRLVAAASKRHLPPPNVDLGLAALGAATAMPDDAGEAIFTCARIVGWLAHAMEEYEASPLRFRPRAVYVG